MHTAVRWVLDTLLGRTIRHVAIAHVTSVGEIEQVNLCDNQKLETRLLCLNSPWPEWFLSRVALLRFCPVGQFVGSVRGRKYTDYMILLHLKPSEYKQLFTFRMD